MVTQLEHESMLKKRLDTKSCIVSSTLQKKIYTFEIYLLFSYKSIALKICHFKGATSPSFWGYFLGNVRQCLTPNRVTFYSVVQKIAEVFEYLECQKA